MNRKLILLALALLLGAAAVWTGVRSLQAKDHLNMARDHLQVARAALLDRRIDDASAAVEKAGAETQRARDLTSDPVTVALSHLPLAGRTLAVGRGMAQAADDLARGVLPDALKAARTLDPKALRRPDGSVDLAVLAKGQGPLAIATSKVEAVNSRVRALPTSLVAGPVAGPRKEFQAQVQELTTSLSNASQALSLAPSLLGGDQPRRWFVLVQQTSESRGTGGIVGGFAVLEANQGKLRVTEQGSHNEIDLPVGEVLPKDLPADFVDRYHSDGAFDFWANANLSPDLPVVARYIAQRYQAQGGRPIDGVIALDAKALALLLKGGAPVPVGPGKSIPPEGIEDYLALGQYADAGENQVGRKDKLVGVARTVTDRLTSGSGDSVALVKGLSAAVRSGHVRIASTDPTLAAKLHQVGIDGGLPRDDAPFAYPVLNNGVGSKLDYFLDRSVTYEGGSCHGDYRRTKVTVRLTSQAPALGQLPPYVSIRLVDGVRTHSTRDQVALSVYATRGAQLERATLSGRPVSIKTQTLSYGVEAGLPVWQTIVDVAPGAPQTLVLELVEPTSKGAPRVLEQPLARDLTSRVALPAC